MVSALNLILAAVVLVIAAITDWRIRRIPNWLTIPAIILALLLHVIWPPASVGFYLIGLLPAVAMIIGALTKNQFGWGDIKLMIFLGLVLGGYAPIFVFGVSLVFMCIYAIIRYIARSGQAGMPMAPFILFATFIIFAIDLTSLKMIY